MIRTRGRRAFTIIELIVVVVIMAILAGVALPRFFSYDEESKIAACRGALGGIRAGIAQFRLNQSLTGGAVYPTTAQLTTPGLVMQEELPMNPFNELNDVEEILLLATATARGTDGSTGWRYYVDNAVTPTSVVLWANSSTAGVDEQDF
jgi:prepilin-type N-terminal cleavage/methylation domain-containing protein